MTGVQLIMECLKAHHVTTLFGYPGGAIMPTYDALYDARHRPEVLERILCVARHRGFTVTTMDMTLIETQVQLKITVKSDRTFDLLVNQLAKLPDVNEIK
ncbi:Acetolactate synthase isozyme 2 small subunit [Haemophilus influenzae]|nr:acetolactate synthase 2 small subunit [Haemophilus influenzae]SQG35806.1 Acetolactate synthase isozyme 2 small subunit [Haemophilus influenzae]